MKKLMTFIAVLICLSVSITVYAQSEHITANEQSLTELQEAQRLSDEALIDLENAQREADMAALNEQRLTNGEPRLADGEPGRGTLENPHEYWEANGYPDNISFAYEAGGEMLGDGTLIAYWEIGVVNADEAGRQEIINLLSPSCRITFRDCTWSYNQRKAAFDEIYASRGDIVRNAVMALNSETVVVEIAEGYEKKYAQRYIEQYGWFVTVTNDIPVVDDANAGDGAGFAAGGLGTGAVCNDIPGAAAYTGDSAELVAGGLETGAVTNDISIAADEDALMEGALLQTMPNSKRNNNFDVWLLPMCLMLLIGTVTVVYFNRSRLMYAMQTDNGNIFAGRGSISRKQIVAAIRNSALTPSEDVFKSVMERVDNMLSVDNELYEEIGIIDISNNPKISIIRIGKP